MPNSVIRQSFPAVAVALAVVIAAPAQADPTKQAQGPQDMQVEFYSDGMRLPPSSIKPADSYCAKNVTNAGFTVDNGGGSPFAKCSYNKTWVNYKVTLVSPPSLAGKVVSVHSEQTSPVGSDYVFTPTQCSGASSDKVQCLPGALPNYVFSADIIVWPTAGSGGSAGSTQR
jgi:hypothetical protein